MTRTAEGQGSWSFEDPREGQPDHELVWIAQIEYHTDYVPYGSTSVPLESAEVVSCSWELDGRPLAEWALDHELRTMGLSVERVKEIKAKAEETWSSDESW